MPALWGVLDDKGNARSEPKYNRDPCNVLVIVADNSKMSVILSNAGDGDTVGHGRDGLRECVVRVSGLYRNCLE